MTTLTALAIGGLAAGVAGVMIGTLSMARVVRLRKECRGRAHEAEPRATGGIDPRAIRNVAMLRYDPFRDMAGRLSFSLALLDSTGDGVVLTSINAHSETRTYAKVIRGGECTHDLSPEEQQVVGEARDGKHARSAPGEQAPARSA